MKLKNKRDLFEIPEDITYLNCAYMSPLMHRVVEAGKKGLLRKKRPWEIEPQDFFTGSDALRDAFAQLINADGEDIAIVPAASYGISTAAKNLSLSEGQSIVVVEDQFPSNVYPWREKALSVGGLVTVVTRPLDEDWTQAVINSIDETTAIVALPQCHWTDGGLFDLERISSFCRSHDIALSVDVTQSVGAHPLDVRRIEPDFLTAASYKWLMGPYSLGLLYVSKRWQREGQPIEHNWVHRKGAEDFGGIVEYQDEFAPGARRFDVGERANFALVPAAEEGIRQILDWGVENIAETTSELTDSIAEKAKGLGLRSISREKRAGHYLGLEAEGGFSQNVVNVLAQHKIFVSMRGTCIRVTPHVYNDEADVDRFIEAISKVL